MVHKILSLTTILVETLELSIALRDETLQLRVEIFENAARPGHYSFRIWRIEHYRIQSTFPQVGGVPNHAASDEVILKEFEGFQFPTEPRALADRFAASTYALQTLGTWLTEQLGVDLG